MRKSVLKQSPSRRLQFSESGWSTGDAPFVLAEEFGQRERASLEACDFSTQVLKLAKTDSVAPHA